MDKDSRLDESIKMISSMAISDIDVNRHINLIECQEKARKIEQFYRKLEDVVEMVDSAKSSFTTLITNQFVAGCNHQTKNEIKDIIKEYENLRTRVFHFLLNLRKSKQIEAKSEAQEKASRTSYTSKTLSSDMFQNIISEIKENKIMSTVDKQEQLSVKKSDLKLKKSKKIRSYLRLHPKDDDLLLSQKSDFDENQYMQTNDLNAQPMTDRGPNTTRTKNHETYRTTSQERPTVKVFFHNLANSDLQANSPIRNETPITHQTASSRVTSKVEIIRQESSGSIKFGRGKNGSVLNSVRQIKDTREADLKRRLDAYLSNELSENELSSKHNDRARESEPLQDSNLKSSQVSAYTSSIVVTRDTEIQHKLVESEVDCQETESHEQASKIDDQYDNPLQKFLENRISTNQRLNQLSDRFQILIDIERRKSRQTITNFSKNQEVSNTDPLKNRLMVNLEDHFEDDNNSLQRQTAQQQQLRLSKNQSGNLHQKKKANTHAYASLNEDQLQKISSSIRLKDKSISKFGLDKNPYQAQNKIEKNPSKFEALNQYQNELKLGQPAQNYVGESQEKSIKPNELTHGVKNLKILHKNDSQKNSILSSPEKVIRKVVIKKKIDAPLDLQQLSGRSRVLNLNKELGLIKNRNSSVRSLSPSSFQNLVFKNQRETSIPQEGLEKKDVSKPLGYLDLRSKQPFQVENRSSIKLSKHNSQYQFYLSNGAGVKANNSSTMSTSDTKKAKNINSKPAPMSLNLNSEVFLGLGTKKGNKRQEEITGFKSNRTGIKPDDSYYRSYIKKRETKDLSNNTLFNQF